MEKIAKFERVSEPQFTKDFLNTFPDTLLPVSEVYSSLILPKRATMGSAGYDFFSPVSFTLKPNESIKIPTGIRAQISDGWLLQIFPRSGLGFKYRLQLDNTVGIIDADYYHSDNEGHIFCKITNDSKEGKTITLNKNEGFAQGVFTMFGITQDDEVCAVRNGGFGSTSKI